MSWLIGIDEAGYGPNLGPLVQTVVACRVPEAGLDLDLWDHLQAAVRKPGKQADDRLLIADSKQVYSTARGLAALEHGVVSSLACFSASPGTLHDLVHQLASQHLDEISAECWYQGDTPLPIEETPERIATSTQLLRSTCESKGLVEVYCQSVVVCAPRFNALIERWDNKSIVLSLGLVKLLQDCLEKTAAEPTRIVVDKQGGRNQYAALLNEAFYGGFVFAEEEGANRSTYSVRGLDRAVNVCFEPRADDGHFTVALASMISKYLREVLMREFNSFWQSHIPGLKSTAGYPNDAIRYIQAIRPTLEKLGVHETKIWRSR